MRNPFIVVLIGIFASANVWSESDLSAADMIDIPLEALMQMDAVVNTASKKEERLGDTASAVFVITAEDIKRSGVTNIPEALRLAPGIQVGRISPNEWGVSSRGLGGLYSRYLLVLIDGRSIYTSLYSGVSWDEQNLILENIERIEVIRGPDGSVWGANAVNGVINIMTKAASHTAPVEFYSYAGDEVEKGYIALNAVTQLSDHQHLRLGLSHKENGALQQGTPGDDDWTSQRVSLAYDYSYEGQSFDVDAEYGAVDNVAAWPRVTLTPPFNSVALEDDEKRLYFVQAKYQNKLSNDDVLSLRVSLDRTERSSVLNDWNTANRDIDVEYQARVSESYAVNAGINMRFTESEYVNKGGFPIRLIPSKRDTEQYSVYIHNELIFSPTFHGVLAMRVDNHSLVDSSVQPTVRLVYAPNDRHRVWGAVSRAESTPSRVLEDVSITDIFVQPGTPETFNLPTRVSVINDGQGAKNVTLTAYELGYRFLGQSSFDVDVTAFIHEYENLLSISESTDAPQVQMEEVPFVQAFVPFSTGDSHTIKGVELSAYWKPVRNVLFQYSGTFIDTDVSPSFEGVPVTLAVVDGAPQWQHSLRALWDISARVSLDSWLRYVDEYEFTDIDSYTSLDFRLAWSATKQLELSLNIRNLIDDDRIEYQREIFAVNNYRVPRYVFAKLEWKWQ